jgi:hypothetical protein
MHPQSTALLDIPSPPGFDTGYTPPSSELGAPCICGARAGTVPTFTGAAVCEECDRRRTDAATLLAAIVRGATPEELLDRIPAVPYSDPATEVLERDEMRAHVELIVGVLR